MDRIVGKSACEFLSGGVKEVRLTPRCVKDAAQFSLPDGVMLIFGGGGGYFHLLLRET